MQTRFVASLVVGAALLAACSGGGNGTNYTTPPAATGNVPLTDMVAGSPGYVDPATHRTLYYLDVDTPTGGTCTGSCVTIWPIFAPTAGSQASGNFTIITRSDGNGQQWAYQAHPLYHYSKDTGPDQANGDGLAFAGGHWHVARPATATPPPSSGSY